MWTTGLSVLYLVREPDEANGDRIWTVWDDDSNRVWKITRSELDERFGVVHVNDNAGIVRDDYASIDA